MIRRLLQANLNDDTSALEEVQKLLREIRSGWQAIPEGDRQVVAGG
jgi:flagellar protein FliS